MMELQGRPGSTGLFLRELRALTGLSLRQVDMTKLHSFPEKGTYSSYYFFCEVQGHISDDKVEGALKDLEIHCSEFQLLGVFNQDSFRKK